MITHKFNISEKVAVEWEDKVTEIQLILPCYRKLSLGSRRFEYTHVDEEFNVLTIETYEGNIEHVTFDKLYSPESVYNVLKDTEEYDKVDYDYHLDKVKELLK